ncbi:hypothetical protein PGTUg99_015692 [Puccinia graminis f. sp. tritici]|uniref:Uncharacterized protein n=1 Tax=Puccinia graminis f. sp. tritici TaxID=56615 RepID=A0A5B0SDU6_PUCGR|nr:hypothetical protein PGTUg99_015692 [Puccinia graminis f. sp. tritici]
MGKSAKFYKRPSRKEKMGLSSNSNSVRAAIASSKFNRPEPTILPTHERKRSSTDQNSLLNKNQNKPYSLIQDEAEQQLDEEDVQMDVDEGSIKKKRVDLKTKVVKRATKNPAQAPNNLPQDYVELYDKPDRRKSSNRRK